MVEINTHSPEAFAKLLISQYNDDFVEHQLVAAVKRGVLPKELHVEVADLYASLKEEYEKENPDVSALEDLTIKLKTKLNACFQEIKATEKKQIKERPFLERMWNNQNRLDKALIDSESTNFGVQKLATLALQQKIIDKELYESYIRCTRKMQVSLENPDVPFVVQMLWLSGVKRYQEDILSACKKHAHNNPVSVEVRERADRSATYKLMDYKKLRRSEQFKRISEDLQKHAERCCTRLEVALESGDEPIIFIESLRDQLDSVTDDVQKKIDALQNKEDEVRKLKGIEDQINRIP